jgi:hypothetical protein
MRTLWLVLLALAASGTARGQKEITNLPARPTPEIKRLFEAFAGDWDTTEKRERTRFFPNGGERKGRSRVRLGAAGAMLVMEGHSDGPQHSDRLRNPRAGRGYQNFLPRDLTML